MAKKYKPLPTTPFDLNKIEKKMNHEEYSTAFEVIEVENGVPFCEQSSSKRQKVEGLKSLLKDGHTLLSFHGLPYAFEDDLTFTIFNNRLISTHDYNYKKAVRSHKNWDLVGAIVNNAPRNKKNEAFENIIVFNADLDPQTDRNESLDAILDVYGNTFHMPVISYRMLVRLFFDIDGMWVSALDKKIDTIVEKLQDGTLRIVDYTPERTINLSNKEKETWEAQHKIYPKLRINDVLQKTGYTVVGDQWHQASSVLIYNTEKDETYLIAQDEDTYFGVELPKDHYPQTIKEAYELLKPTEARRKKNVKRQGEWFFVPVNNNKLPSSKDCIIYEDYSYCRTNLHNFTLGHDEEGNPHYVTCNGFMITKDGRIFAYDTSMIHDDHDDVQTMGWHQIVENTAVRSYSEEGVD